MTYQVFFLTRPAVLQCVFSDQHVKLFLRDGSKIFQGGRKGWGILPKCGNLRIGTKLKTVKPETQAMPQSRIYNEVPVQSVSLYFFHDIQFCFQFFCFSKEGVASHPIQPSLKRNWTGGYMQFSYVVNIFLFLFSTFENLWKKHRMNANREAVNGTDFKFANDELDVYNLDEDQLWTSLELEEMRTRKTSQTKKSSSGSDKTKTIGDEPETAPKKEVSRVKASEGTSGEESKPNFYHGVGPFNDVNLPGVWFFRIPHKVIRDNLLVLT